MNSIKTVLSKMRLCVYIDKVGWLTVNTACMTFRFFCFESVIHVYSQSSEFSFILYISLK